VQLEDDLVEPSSTIEEELPTLHYFLTYGSPDKQSIVMLKVLKLMRHNKTVPVRYVIKHRLYKHMTHVMATYHWRAPDNVLLAQAAELATLMLIINPALKQELKTIGFLKVFCEACQKLEQKHSLYELAEAFYKESTLTVLQLANKHMLFNTARDEAKYNNDAFAERFVKNTISYYGNVLLKLVKLSLKSSGPEATIINSIVDIPVYFKQKECAGFFALLRDVERLLRKDRPPEVKLNIIKNLVNTIIELLFYWPWLRYSHAYGICTSHAASEHLTFCRNPLLFTCEECKLTLCSPCASKHHHPFSSLEFCGYNSPAVQCTCATTPVMSGCDCFSIFDVRTSISFLSKIDHDRHYNLLSNGRCLTLVENKDYFSVLIDHNDGLRELVGGEPLFSEEDKTDQELTLAYFEVEVKSGGIKDAVSIGFTGFQYRGDTGEIMINDKVQSKGPKFGSYDCVGIGVTHTRVYLTYNGLLLQPYHPHPTETDYRLLITLEGMETMVNVRLNSNIWLFKPPYDCSIIEQKFTPSTPDFINADFITNMKRLFSSCDGLRKVPELAEVLGEIKGKIGSIFFMLEGKEWVHNKKVRSKKRKHSDHCRLF
jgi:hypothetical protein